MPSNIIKTDYSVGDFIDECKVIKSIGYQGLVMEMPNDIVGSVHISRIADEVIEKIPKKYQVGSTHRCRVLGYSGMDSCFTLTMKQTDFDIEYLQHDSIKAGSIVKGEIVAFEKFGLIVKITKHIKGICQLQHMSDVLFTQIKRPAQKFVPGKKIKCRVLSVDAEKKVIQLTHKKTLLETEYQIITDHADVSVGERAHGVVIAIKEYGLIILFYNNIRGLLPKKNMRLSAGKSLEQLYFVGQVLLVNITDVKVQQKKITLSLKEGETLTVEKESYEKGELLSSTSVNKEDDHLVVKLPDKSEACLPFQHITDFVKLSNEWESISSTLSKKQKFKDVRYNGRDKKTSKNVVSKKEVLSNYNTDVKTFEDLKPHMILPGTITSVLSYGLFIEVAPGVVGLSPSNFIADNPIGDLCDIFTVGQSVVAKVNDRMDLEKKRFTLTLKPSLLMKHAENEKNVSFCSNGLLQLYLKQRSDLHKAAIKSSDAITSSLPTLIGELIIAKVLVQEKDGVKIEYKSADTTIYGFINNKFLTDVTVEQDGDIHCYVFNVDLKKKIFHATADKLVIEGVVSGLDTSQEISENTRVEGSVVYVDSDICILTLPDFHHTLAYMTPKKHINHMLAKPKILLNQHLHLQCVGLFGKSVMVRRSDETITTGSIVSGFVKGIKPNQLSIDIQFSRVHGRVHITQICDEIVEGKSPLTGFKIKEAISARVIAIRDLKTHSYLPISHPHSGKSYVELSMKPSVIKADSVDEAAKFAAQDFKEFKVGDQVNCFTTSTCSQWLYVAINSNVKAKIPFLHLSKEIKEIKKLVNEVSTGYPLSAKVINIEKEKETLVLSRIGQPGDLVQKGKCVVGRIINKTSNKGGLFIQLPGMKAGVAHITELNDVYNEKMLDGYEDDDFVDCVILNINKKKIDLSLRQSRINKKDCSEGEDRFIDGYDDMKEGDILRGYVKSCTKVGVFVTLAPGIDARVQIKNLSQFFVKEFQSRFTPGTLVKGKILKIDPSTNHIDFSLRGKDVGEADLFPAPERKRENTGNEDGVSPSKKIKLADNDDDDSDDEDVMEIEDGDVEDKSSDEMESSDEENDETSTTMESAKGNIEGKKPKVLKLSSKFDWMMESEITRDQDGSCSSDENDENEDEESKTSSNKLSKRQKKAAKKAEEDSIRKAELTLLDTDREVESMDDFERLILGSPNSSIIWIQYMAFHLHSSEVDKARKVAQRALKAISFREEQEKFNVWVALLNLQAVYGTKGELEKTFRDAVKVNEPKKVYMKMVDIYVKDEKFQEEAESLYQEMLKKFKSSKAVWISYGWYLMKKGDAEGARNLLTRSMKSLPQRKYIDTMVKFAMFEYKFGEAQRGSTVFETVLKHYPKRSDLWSIYIDMTIKQQDLEQVRNIFERVTTLALSSKKMQFFFKRYIQFEEQHGTAATIKTVRNKAMEYAESKFVES